MKCADSTRNGTESTGQLEFRFDAPARPAEPEARPQPRPATPGSAAPSRPSAGAALRPMSPPPSLPPGARWREVETGAQTIGFVLLRSRRKSIGLVVNDDGLRITAPNWVTLRQVDAAVVEKANWIFNKLNSRDERRERLATAQTHWQDGGTIPYLGKRITLELDESQRMSIFKGEIFSPDDGDRLCLALPGTAEHSRVRDSVHAWLQQQAAAWFELRLQHFLRQSQLRIRQWKLSAATARWGSCSADGSIRLNWRLIHFDHSIIDYVIAHELAHLREMNHGPDFWREVGRILPGFEAARNALRRHDPDSLPLI